MVRGESRRFWTAREEVPAEPECHSLVLQCFAVWTPELTRARAGKAGLDRDGGDIFSGTGLPSVNVVVALRSWVVVLVSTPGVCGAELRRGMAALSLPRDRRRFHSRRASSSRFGSKPATGIHDGDKGGGQAARRFGVFTSCCGRPPADATHGRPGLGGRATKQHTAGQQIRHSG